MLALYEDDGKTHMEKQGSLPLWFHSFDVNQKLYVGALELYVVPSYHFGQAPMFGPVYEYIQYQRLLS